MPDDALTVPLATIHARKSMSESWPNIIEKGPDTVTEIGRPRFVSVRSSEKRD